MDNAIAGNTHHPSTLKAECINEAGIAWDAQATVHLKADRQGLFDPLKGLYRGSLADMVALVYHMPEGERHKFEIQKAGDRRLGIAEITALARRADFPSRI
jgi:hypothetical protein